MPHQAPLKIKLHRQSQTLELQFAEASFTLSAEYLRVFSPSAEVRGHGAGQEILQLDKEKVGILNLEAQGNYALRIYFDDNHDTGIYTWNYLYELGEKHTDNWQEYLTKVALHNNSSLATPAK